MNDLTTSIWGRIKAYPIWSAAAAVVLLALIVVLASAPEGGATHASYYETKRGDFLISIVEGGTLEAVQEVSVRNEVEGTARIIYIVPEGSYVKKGDLLVELDSAQAQDQVNQQEINFTKAQFALVQAEQQLEIQKSTVESEVQAAELAVEFAQKDLEKYAKGESQQERRNAQIEITNVLETLRIAEERLVWTEELYKQGFETKGNLDKDRLAVSQSRLKLEQAQTTLQMFEDFDYPKKKRQLEADLKEAQDNLARTKLQGERKLDQYKADVETQRSTLELNRNKLDRDKEQLTATKIYAPKSGLVVYATGSGRFSSDSLIEEGATVRNRQELIKLPDISSMKVSVKIHESYVNQVHPGQQAFVVLDSMPDKRFAAIVDQVALLPDGQSRWANPNLKVYSTQVRIVDPLPDVKPGVSARAEIIITNLPDAVTVPIQAVTTRGGKQVVYVQGDPPQAVPVTVGMYNTKMIEIASGLDEGARVLLSPPLDVQEKDLGGRIIADGEKVPEMTNVPPPAVQRQSGPPQSAGPDEGGRQSRRRFSEGGAEGQSAGRGGRPRFNREEMVKRFDTDGDGEISETERAAMFEQMRAFRRDRTNAPPTSPPQP